MAKFAKSLEEKASDIAAFPKKQLWDTSIPGMIQREIALTIDQMKRLKERHDEQLRRLLRLECYVDTDLIQMEQRQPRYMPYHFLEKEKLEQRQLFLPSPLPQLRMLL